MNEILAAGPVPRFVSALTLKVYEVKAFRLGISMEMESSPSTRRASCWPESVDPSICVVHLYPMMKPLCCSIGIGDQDTLADVGHLKVTSRISG